MRLSCILFTTNVLSVFASPRKSAFVVCHYHHHELKFHLPAPHKMMINNGGNEANQAGAMSELEIEKKFPVSDDPIAFDNLQRTLSRLGFEMTHQEEFIDWYFDLPAWHLTLNDIWVRYREKKREIDTNTDEWKGVWQIKRGDINSSRQNDGITSYQEFQGAAAEELILDLLSNTTIVTEDSHAVEAEQFNSLDFAKGDVPHLDGAEKLVPFSKFKVEIGVMISYCPAQHRLTFFTSMY